MSASFFLDTNVFVYEVSRRQPAKQAIAARLVDDALNSGNGTISFQVVQEFFSVAFRRFNPPMTVPEAHEAMANTFGPLRTIHSSYRLYQRALELSRPFSLTVFGIFRRGNYCETGSFAFSICINANCPQAAITSRPRE